MINNVTGILLAGGKSSRMGTDKSFLEVSGASMIENIISKLKDLFSKVIIITNNPKLYEKFGVKTQTDLVSECGPLAGIYTGLMVSDDFYNFVVACDMPHLNVELIKYMLEHSQGFDVIVPEYKGKLEPLHCMYTKKCLIPIKNRLDRGLLKINDFFEDVKLRKIKEEEILKFDKNGSCFSNINTSKEYELLKARLD